MFKQILISIAISTALISTTLLAQESSVSDNPQTTGERLSEPNDAGGKGMMSSEHMQGMDGMHGKDGMMSDMSPEDRKAMMETCMKMMQSHDSDNMDGGMKDKGAETQ